ncbi:MAG: pilus assembly protein TadG-related protein [Actinomycetota bacterium]|nr:pilus assembly protein TadG-related protein [Actinomycetota bacterium]
MSSEEGSITLWLLGLVLIILALGGLAIDLWRGFNERRALAGIADSAAIAGAAALDEAAFRGSGRVRLDPAAAESLATRSVWAQPDSKSMTGFSAAADADQVTVVVRGAVDLTLLRLLAPDRGPLRISVRATVSPRGSP